MSAWATDRRARGFTLIELMIVISIIAILIIILIPGLQITSKEELRTKQIMNALRNALEAYEKVYGMYPPSDNGSVGTGAQCLYYYLMGPREEGWGINSADGGVPAKYLWAPPKDLQNDWMVGGGPGTDIKRKFFCDGDVNKDRAILYYRADVGSGLKFDDVRPVKYTEVYDKSDNNGSGAFWTPKTADWKSLVMNRDSPNEAPYNPRTYLLIAPGRDRTFGYVDGTTDDVTNYKRKD
jgi:prepilin-type N-terminal cleavage/methylation domain-containing protein